MGDELYQDRYYQDKYYPDKFYPRYHYRPEKNWMNDPNGLIYMDGW